MPPPFLLLIAAVAAAVLVPLITVVAVRDGQPFALDTALHEWALDHRTPDWADTFTFVTHTGSGIPPMVVAAVAGALAVRSRRWRAWLPGAVAGVIALLTAQALRYGLVTALGRPRPPESGRLLHVDSPAMPSGHTTTSALVAIGLAAALLPYCQRAFTRALAVAVPVTWAVAVGFSRVYLAVHWATDVLAGWLFATAVLSLCLPFLALTLRRIAAAPPTRTGGP